jgi:hypothetical protein
VFLGISPVLWAFLLGIAATLLAGAGPVLVLRQARQDGTGMSPQGRRLLAAALLVVTGLAAWGLPTVIPDGISGLSGLKRDAAVEAPPLAWQMGWENQLERLSITRIAVVHVDPLPEPAERGSFVPDAVVHAYTLFGWPYSQVTMNQDGLSVDWRLPTPILGWALVVGAVLAAYALTNRGGSPSDGVQRIAGQTR